MTPGPWVAAACAIAALTACDHGSSAPPPVDVVRVTVDGCGLAPEIATGFRLAGGLVVTVAHVLSGYGPVTVDGAPATVLALDVRADVGVLQAGSAVPARNLDRVLRAPAQGDAVMVARFDRGAVVHDPAHVLSVTSITFHDVVAGTAVSRDGLIVDLGIFPGDSGSPVIGEDGRIVGIMFANAHDVGAKSYAVSSTEIRTILAHVADGTAPTERPPC